MHTVDLDVQGKDVYRKIEQGNKECIKKCSSRQYFPKGAEFTLQEPVKYGNQDPKLNGV